MPKKPPTFDRDSLTGPMTGPKQRVRISDHATAPILRVRIRKTKDGGIRQEPVYMKGCPHCGATMTPEDHGKCPGCKRHCGCSFNPTSMSDFCRHHRPRVYRPGESMGKLTPLDHLGAITRLRMLERKVISAARHAVSAGGATKLWQALKRLDAHKAFMKRHNIKP